MPDVKKITTVADLLPDHANANAGTSRGADMLRVSLQRNGAGRSIVVDREGRIIAGNKTAEAAGAEHIPIKVVTTDGSELVVVQRTDLDLSDPRSRARELAFADNRIGEVNLNWDEDVIKDAYAAGALDGLDYLFSDDELNRIVGDALIVNDHIDGLDDEPNDPGEVDPWASTSDRDPTVDTVDFSFGDYAGKVERDVYDTFAALIDDARSKGCAMMTDIIAEIVRLAEAGNMEDDA